MNHKFLITIAILSLLNSCRPPCNPIPVENGPIPDKALACVPYKDGETYKLIHTEGLVIEFASTRKTTQQWSECTECCKYEYHYETNHTLLIPDYPIFNIEFYISNMDTSYIQCYGTAGKYGFGIPTQPEQQYPYYKQIDSMFINSEYYYDIFGFKTDNGYSYQDSIRVDSIFYNYEFGIVKILMSNGETYSVYR